MALQMRPVFYVSVCIYLRAKCRQRPNLNQVIVRGAARVPSLRPDTHVREKLLIVLLREERTHLFLAISSVGKECETLADLKT